MPRFGETRFLAALFGLAAGLVVAVGAQPASAQLVVLDPGDSGTTAIGTPLVLFGETDRPTLGDDGSFMHTFDFTVDLGGLPQGNAFVSVTPNVLPPDGINNDGMTFLAGFQTFMGEVTGPGGPFSLVRDGPPELPRSNTIAAEFAAMDGDMFTLTITGTLLDSVLGGNYTGNIGVTPLPGAALVLLSALGGLVAVRRFRQNAAPTA
ncbi:MAG: hypothetical protein R3349_00705 [Geminicoccaceae bacterium]|nr:hypothetical protein [Geminicoccaceae bacterium]